METKSNELESSPLESSPLDGIPCAFCKREGLGFTRQYSQGIFTVHVFCQSCSSVGPGAQGEKEIKAQAVAIELYLNARSQDEYKQFMLPDPTTTGQSTIPPGVMTYNGWTLAWGETACVVLRPNGDVDRHVKRRIGNRFIRKWIKEISALGHLVQGELL
jgi:hypothetical protein